MRICPHCSREIEQQAALFCPFCGSSVSDTVLREGEPPEVKERLRALEDMNDLRKKHRLLLELEKEYPQSLLIAQEILMLGRLYERDKQAADFSIIKSYLLQLYLTPNQFKQDKQDAMREELFAHPQLLRCLSLCEEETAFLRTYLQRLSSEFIKLFLRGNSQYMRTFFGFTQHNRAPRYLAVPAARMLQNMLEDDGLAPARRELLAQSFYQAFSREMSGETEWLDKALEERGAPAMA